MLSAAHKDPLPMSLIDSEEKPITSEVTSTLAEEIEKLLKPLQNKIKENGEEFINSLVSLCEKNYRTNLNTLLFPEIKIETASQPMKALGGRIIEMLTLSHAFELDSKEEFIDKNTRRILCSRFLHSPHLPLDKPLQEINFLKIQNNYFGDCLLLYFANLTEQQANTIVELYKKHYPSIDVMVGKLSRNGEIYWGLQFEFGRFLSDIIQNMQKVIIESNDSLLITLKENFSAFKASFQDPLPTNKYYIPFDQLTFVGDEEKINGALINYGAAGAIYAATLAKEKVKEDVIVKFYWQGHPKGCFANFLNESFTMSQFHSSYIIHFKGIVHHADAGYGIVMKRYLRSLRTYLAKNKNIPFHLQLKWAWQITAGLAEMHKNHWLHRDLRADNIFLDDGLNVIVADLDAALPEFFPGGSAGNEAYLAPEFFLASDRFHPILNSKACDTYTLGVILWEILTGKMPFQGSRPAFIAQTKRSDQPHEIIPDCPEIFKQWISACWDNDPAKRPTAETLSHAFKSAYDEQKLVNKKRKGLPSHPTPMAEETPSKTLIFDLSNQDKELSAPSKPEEKKNMSPDPSKETVSPISLFTKKPKFDLSNIAYAITSRTISRDN